VYDSDLTAKKYETMLTMLKGQIFLIIRQVASTNFAKIWYQQDSASPQWYKNYSIKMRAYLTQYRKGEIEWPARSRCLISSCGIILRIRCTTK